MAETVRSLRIFLSYDGTDFSGWQIQPGKRTVQGVLKEALRQLGDNEAICQASGRTDAGVHAGGQVVGVRTKLSIPLPKMRGALQAFLPKDVVIKCVAEAPSDFDPTRWAISKMYRYTIRHGVAPDVFSRQYCLYLSSFLDAGSMAEAAKSLIGTYDFRAFESRWPNRASSVRTITMAEVRWEGGWIWLEITSNGFLYNMVRAIVGTLILIGRKVKGPDFIGQVLHAGKRSLAGPTAPAHGLCLERVDYPPPLDMWPE